MVAKLQNIKEKDSPELIEIKDELTCKGMKTSLMAAFT